MPIVKEIVLLCNERVIAVQGSAVRSYPEALVTVTKVVLIITGVDFLRLVVLLVRLLTNVILMGWRRWEPVMGLRSSACSIDDGLGWWYWAG